MTEVERFQQSKLGKKYGHDMKNFANMFLCRFNKYTVYQVKLFWKADIEKQASYIFQLQRKKKKSLQVSKHKNRSRQKDGGYRKG